MENIFLNDDEIIAMTRRMRHKQQVTALDQLGVMYILRHDGSPLVLREHVRDLLGGFHPVPKIVKPPGDAINAVNARILAFRAHKLRDE